MNVFAKLSGSVKLLPTLFALLTLLAGQTVYAQNRGLESEFMMELTLELGQQMNAGETMIGPISGGSFSGPGIQGEVLPGGADWMTMSDGHNNLDVRIALETSDGDIIYMTYTGILQMAENPADGYWTVAISFNTALGEYDWMNHIVAVGKGAFVDGNVVYDIYRIL